MFSGESKENIGKKRVDCSYKDPKRTKSHSRSQMSCKMACFFGIYWKLLLNGRGNC